MNSFLFSLVILVTFNTYAFDSKVTFSIDDMKKSNLVLGASGGNKDQMLTVAARVFQLQLEAAKCEGVIVNQLAMIASEKNDFSVSSKNCAIKSKKAETCDSGFAARNIPENPRTPDDAIIGGDTYKICIKDSGNGSNETPAPNSRSSR